ncbi:cyclic nucleotide-binding domain protein (macronuclear) [Tetrahymena thermophila SB210]|uniref:Cyclic nucleotide-binding domain protein n=1 Tax=Tetrahymena thermophila (strain SB210) TaxID=312017 RepID=I7MGE5_TETTS|nr:cyclic nucleotide-binding domain protein [Tetrahymena thermophila SB210]EAR85084.1 cyclic nucleotide-binding domain protein [Tetrahymena thermophila SB210]|eukprot:XP_001032747.1 cyclic nucleotide-binding domain protein [Tetrahymena thermophila SB210]
MRQQVNKIKDEQISLLKNQEDINKQANITVRQRQLSQSRSQSRKKTYQVQKDIIKQGLQDETNIQCRKRIDLQCIIPILHKLPEERTVQDLNELSSKLASLDFFEQILSDESLKNKHKLLKEMRIEIFSQNGQIIFNEGDQSNKFYVVLSGGVKLIQIFYQKNSLQQNNTRSSQTNLCDAQQDIVTPINRLIEQDTKHFFQQGQYFGQNELIFYSKRFYSAITFNNQIGDKSFEQETILIYFNQNIFNNLLQDFIINQNPFFRSFSLLKLVPKEGKVRISYEHQIKQLSLNEVVYKQDQKVEYIYYLDSGNVQLNYSQKQILDVLPHSVQQKKQQTQIISTIPEKSFFGDEDLLNLNGTRKYSATISSIKATLYLFDANMFYEEIVQAYGIVKTNKMINDYLLSKQKWRDEHIQQAINIKNQFSGFQYCGSKLNQNLVLKNQSDSKQNLQNISNRQFLISQNQQKKVSNASISRCVTEEQENKQSYLSRQLNSCLSQLQVGQINTINQNHLKTLNYKNHSKKSNQNNISDVEKYFKQNIKNERSHQNNLNNFLINQFDTCKQINQKFQLKRPIKNSKFNTIDSELSLSNDYSLQKSQINQTNQNNTIINRCESLTLDDQNGESMLIFPNQFLKSQQIKQQAQGQKASFSQYSQNKSLFKIRLQKMEDHEKNNLSEINTFCGHTSLILSGKHNLSFQNLSPGGQKIYDPFNDCWVKRSSPKKNNIHTQNYLENTSINNEHLKYQVSIDSPFSKQLNQSVYDLSDPSYLSISKQSLAAQQYQLDIKVKNHQNNQQNCKKVLKNLNIQSAISKKCVVEGKEKRRNLQNNLNNKINSSSNFNQEIQNNTAHSKNQESNEKKKQNSCQQKIEFTVNQQQSQKVLSNSMKILKIQNANIGEQVQHAKENFQQNKNKSGQKMSQIYSINDQQKQRTEYQQLKMQNQQYSLDDQINSQQQDQNHINIESCNDLDSYQERSNLFKSLRKKSIEQENTSQKIAEQNLNRFIEENCSGNEIYQIECNNLLGKKKQILKYLLSQIGSADLNCIDMNQDQKNTKYDNLLRILMKQKQENKKMDCRSSKNFSNSLQKYNSRDEIQKQKLKNFEGNFSKDFQSIERQKFSPNQKEREKFQQVNKSTSNAFQQYLRFANDIINKEINSSQTQMGNLSDQAINISDQINQFTQSYTPVNYPLNSTIKEKKRNTGLKQKLEMRRKLKTPSQSYSVNKRDNRQESTNFSNLHQTLFILPKSQFDL